MPSGGITPVRNLLNAACIFEELHRFQLQYEGLQQGKTIQLDDVVVTPYRTTHLESLKRLFQDKYPQSFEAFSFLIEAPGLRIAHSADIGSPEDLSPLLAQPVDLLVCEMAHFEPETLFAFLKGVSLRRLVFIHVAREYWENLDQIRTMTKRMIPDIKVSFARDGDQFEI